MYDRETGALTADQKRIMAQTTCVISRVNTPAIDSPRSLYVDTETPAISSLISRSKHIASAIDGMNPSTKDDEVLMGPYHYLDSRPGKDIRSLLIQAFNAWLDVPASSLAVIQRMVGMLHTASLLLDDIQDNSKLRRGAPVAHDVFGVAQTINSANYVYFRALQELSALPNPELLHIYTAELLNLHHGQGMELFWRDTATCPTDAQYLEMVSNKTGGLFRLAVRCMCAESQPTQPAAKYTKLANMIGVLFQILDDYRNLTDGLYTTNKGLCEDLTEGKFSFPIIHAIQSDPGNSFLLDILQQHTEDAAVKRDAVLYIDGQGSLSYTQRVLRRLAEETLALVDEVDDGRGRGQLLKDIIAKFMAV
jgi:geranylgeranyl diphosphate synthase type 3